MSKENKVVEKKDLVSFDIYSKNRKTIRKELVEFKKNRRVSIGPYATFYFESYETMLGQIQEMLYIEKGGDDQLKDELNAYNPLIPKGNELVATLMFEIGDVVSRQKFLNSVGGIENNVYMLIEKQKIMANPEKDLDRTSEEGKASSVQFLHFVFTAEQILKFKNSAIKVEIGINHPKYNHKTEIVKETREALIKDFD